MKPSRASEYLSLLGATSTETSLSSLEALIQKQLEHFPYENVSKLLQAERGEQRIPPLEEYLGGCEHFGFGSTCYAQNIYFGQLLQELGYGVQLLASSVDGVPRHHINCQVSVGASTYIVDFGLSDPFCGPFDENGPRVERKLGGRDFTYRPLGRGKFLMEIHKDGKRQRRFDQTEPLTDISMLKKAVLESFEHGTHFMSNLIIGKRAGNPCYNIRNNVCIESRGAQVSKRPMKDLSELEAVIQGEMGLNRYPVAEIVSILKRRGVDLFAKTE
jgi:arylamine N-acetyltransferase